MGARAYLYTQCTVLVVDVLVSACLPFGERGLCVCPHGTHMQLSCRGSQRPSKWAFHDIGRAAAA